MSDVDPVLRQRFLLGMSHAAATVNVVTTDGAAGRHGVTVSAMVSVSADTPQPTLLVCIHQKSAVAEALLRNGVFCVNVLRDDQAHISDNFAGRSGVHGKTKFACAQWTTQVTGAPRVVDSLVAFDCKVTASDRIGSHFLSLFRDAGVEPLIGYRTKSLEMLRGFVGHGLGYSILATKPANNVSYDGRALIARPLSNPVKNSRLVLATLANRTLSPVAQEFAAHCRSFFGGIHAHPNS